MLNKYRNILVQYNVNLCSIVSIFAPSPPIPQKHACRAVNETYPLHAVIWHTFSEKTGAILINQTKQNRPDYNPQSEPAGSRTIAGSDGVMIS